MPSIKTAAQEERIHTALDELSANPTLKIAPIARKHLILASTLRHHVKGRPAQNQRGGQKKVLNTS